MALSYEITERIAVLSQNGNTTKELNKVSYNGAKSKYDIRNWIRTDGEEKMLKGVTLDGQEMEVLKKVLENLQIEQDNTWIAWAVPQIVGMSRT